MKPPVNFLSLCCAAVAIAFAATAAAQQSSLDLLNQLENAMRAELTKHPREQPVGDRGNRAQIEPETILMQLRPTITRADGREREEVWSQILVGFHSEEVRALTEQLRATLRGEREAREKAFIGQTQSLLEQAKQAVQNARVPADLDATIRDLSAIDQRHETGSDELKLLMNRLQSTRQFVVQWQDYLVQAAAKQPRMAKQTLQNLSSINGVNILPRSEIAARLAEFKDEVEDANRQVPPPFERMREILNKTTKFEDLPDAIDALEAIRREAKWLERDDNPVTMLQRELIGLRGKFEDFKAGRPFLLHTRQMVQQQPVAPDAVQMAFPLKLQLMRLAFPRYLRVEETPAPNESMDKYADRMMDVAFARSDARLLFRICEMRNAASGTSEGVRWTPTLEALTAAMNQDAAGQFLLAVISYQRALRAGGEIVSARAVGARLNAIKAAHPADYEAGVARFSEKPDIPYTGRSPGDHTLTIKIPGQDPPPSQPGQGSGGAP